MAPFVIFVSPGPDFGVLGSFRRRLWEDLGGFLDGLRVGFESNCLMDFLFFAVLCWFAKALNRPWWFGFQKPQTKPFRVVQGQLSTNAVRRSLSFQQPKKRPTHLALGSPCIFS